MLDNIEKSFVLGTVKCASDAAVDEAVKCLKNLEKLADNISLPVLKAVHMLVDVLGAQDHKKETVQWFTKEMIEKVKSDLFGYMLSLIVEYKE